MTVVINGTTGIVGATWTTAGRPSSPAVGQRGFNTTINGAEIYNGDQWNPMSNGFSATGGTKTTSGAYTIHTFLSSGTFTPDFAGEVEYLVIAGGGSGASGNDYFGGGGGAGGYLTAAGFAVAATGLTVTIGAGGAGGDNTGTNGSNSVFSTITAIGGGTGYAAGGSGGGGREATAAGSGTSGQGNDGGSGGGGSSDATGGGGGSGAIGGAGGGGASGAGGAGTSSSITGSAVTRAGGGGGGSYTGSQGAGGSGGGGAGAGGGVNTGTGGSGTANTGSGGGGSAGVAGAGGSGVVIIRYRTAGETHVISTDPVGKVLQCLQSTLTTSFTTTSTSYVNLLTLAVTPSATSSKIFVSFTTNGGTNNDSNHLYNTIFRGSTEVLPATSLGSRSGAMAVINTATQQQMNYAGCFLDSPNTTSSTTYALKVRVSNATGYWNRSARDNNAATYDGRTVTTLTAWEIGA